MLLSIDINAINGEGKISIAPEVSFDGRYNLRKSFWSYKDEPMPGADFMAYYNDYKSKLPAGIDCGYKIVKKEYGSYSDSPSYAIVRIILNPSPEYIKQRYQYYYSRDFENNLKTNHAKELEAMYGKFDNNTYIRSHGLCVSNDISDDCILSFSSLGLKPLTTLPQLYTLTKVLTDHLNITQGGNYYVRAYRISDNNEKPSLAFDVQWRQPVHQHTELREW